MKKILNIFMLFPLFSFTACMDVIDVELESGEFYVVVEGEVNNIEEQQVLKLSLSGPYFSKAAPVFIEDAHVLLLEDGEEIMEYVDLGNGEYAIDFTGQIGKKYAVQVSLPYLPDYPELSGGRITSRPERLEPVTEITDLYATYESHIFHEEGYNIYTSTYDPSGKGNFYRWTLEVNEVVSPDPRFLILMDDELIDGNDINDLMVSFKPVEKNDKITLYQQSLTKNHYDFLMSIWSQAVNQEGIFDTPAYNPETNLIADIPVMGYFNASAYAVDSIVVGE